MALKLLILCSLPVRDIFCANGNKNAGNSQQKARRERLFIRKSALFAIFCCGFGPGKLNSNPPLIRRASMIQNTLFSISFIFYPIEYHQINTYELLVNPHKTNIIQHTDLTKQYIDLYISLYTYLKQIKSYSAAESLAPKVRELWVQFLSEEIRFNAKKHEALIKQTLEQRGYSIYGLSEELNRIIIEEDFYDSKSLKNALKVLNYRVKLED